MNAKPEGTLVLRILAGALCLMAAFPALAQIRTQPVAAAADDDQYDQQQSPQWSFTRPSQPGRVANSAVGEVGQRQARDQTKGIAPTARIASRIPGRVQSRLRNRVDRDYDPQANALSPFAVAEEQTRSSGRGKR